jgi:release factor glutamine methyltransferase
LGIPIAYLTHQREFYGRIFNVTRATLVPRPETEVLVEEALRVLRANHNLTNIVDLGTGSGCIAITLSLELPNRTVTATDESAAALAVAQHNAQRLGAEHIHFLHGSLLQPLRALLSSDFGQHTVLVANLPYLSPNEYRGNLRFEPRSALVSGHDGLNLYRQLFQELSALPESRRPSYVVLELHAPQADTLIELTKNTFQQCDVQVTPDLAALPRVLTIRLA